MGGSLEREGEAAAAAAAAAAAEEGCCRRFEVVGVGVVVVRGLRLSALLAVVTDDDAGEGAADAFLFVLSLPLDPAASRPSLVVAVVVVVASPARLPPRCGVAGALLQAAAAAASPPPGRRRQSSSSCSCFSPLSLILRCSAAAFSSSSSPSSPSSAALAINLESLTRSLAVSAVPTSAQAPKTTKHHEVKKAGQGTSDPNLSPVVPSETRTATKKASSRTRRRRSAGRGRKCEVV